MPTHVSSPPTPAPTHRFALVVAVAGLWFGSAAAQDGAGTDWRLSLHSDRHADALTIAELGVDDPVALLRPRAGRNIAYVDDELRLTRRDGAWQWSLLVRQSASLATEQQTLQLIAQVEGLGDTTRDRRWQTHVRYEQFSGGGLELGRRFVPAAGWQLSVAAQVLQLQHWRERGLDGPVQFDAASGSYSFDLQSHQADDRKRFPFQQGFASRGSALLLHGELAWDDGPWQLAAGVRDLGWLHWTGLPQQDLVLNTDTQAVDANGFVIYQPLVQGRNSQSGLTRSMSGRWSARARWALDSERSVEASAITQRSFGVLPAIAWAQRVGSVETRLGWQFHEKRVTFGLIWRGLELRAGTDRLGSGAHSRDLALAGTWAW